MWDVNLTLNTSGKLFTITRSDLFAEERGEKSPLL